MFSHTTVLKSFILLPPNSSSTIMKILTEPRFICESTGRIRRTPQLAWRLANWRRQLRWRAVNGGHTAGFLACKLDAWNRFLTIWVEIRTPDAARRSLFNITADDIRFRFAARLFDGLDGLVVLLGRPLFGLRCTLLVCWYNVSITVRLLYG